jgi:hypothetical protein
LLGIFVSKGEELSGKRTAVISILAILGHVSSGGLRWTGRKGKRSLDSNRNRWIYANVTLYGPVVTLCTTR